MSKIKRNRSIYRSGRRHRRGVLRTVLFLVGAFVLGFFLISAIGPVYHFIRGDLKLPSKPSTVAKSGSSAAGPSKGASSAPAVQAALGARGIYLPGSALVNPTALKASAEAAKAAGMNLAVVELKGDDGHLRYHSSVADAVGANVTNASLPDAASAAATLSAAGLTPAAQISCFIDGTDGLTTAYMRTESVLYAGNHSVRFMDQANQFWLNPYSARARQYLTDLAKEAVSAGFKTIILTRVEFPTLGSIDSTAWFGDGLSLSKTQQLQSFVEDLTKQVNAAGGKVIVRLEPAASIGQATTLLGQDQSFYKLSTDGYAPFFCPSAFNKAGITVGARTILSPDLTPGDTVDALSQYALTQIGSGAAGKMTPYLQAYTNTGLGEGFYKTYSAGDISAEIASVYKAGFSSFILYNPAGVYDFTGVKVTQ